MHITWKPTERNPTLLLAFDFNWTKSMALTRAQELIQPSVNLKMRPLVTKKMAPACIFSIMTILQGLPLALSHCFLTWVDIFDWESISSKFQLVLYGFDKEETGKMNQLVFSLRGAEEEFSYEECTGNESHFCIYLIRLPFEYKNKIFSILEMIPLKSSRTFIIFDQPLNRTMRSAAELLEELLNGYTIGATNNTRNLQIDSSINFVISTALPSQSKCLQFGLFDFYFIKEKLFFKKIVTTTQINLLNSVEPQLVLRQDFQQVKIAAVAQESASSHNEVKFSENSNMSEAKVQSGVAVEMYWNFRDMLNFSERAHIGSAVGIKDGKISGLTYELLSNDLADISISQITVKLDRAKVLQFLQPTLASARIKAIFRQPRLSHKRNIFFAPFTYYLWVTLAITWAVLIILMTSFSFFIHKRFDETADFEFFYVSYIWAVAAICQKGWTTPPVSLSMRGIFFTGCLTGLIIYAAYSAVIMATLAVKQVPIKSFHDLLAYKFRFYAHELSWTMQNFVKVAIVSEYNLTQGVLTTNTADEVRILLRASNALVSYEDVFYSAVRTINYTDNFLCNYISLVTIDSAPQKMAMFTRKSSPLLEHFNYKILMMRERGFISRYLEDYTRKTTPVCDTPSTGTAQYLDMSDLYVAFCFVLVGILAAVVILLLEKLASAHLR